MLKSLDLILRQWSLVGDLESSTQIITSFLGLSRNMSLSKACTFGSIQLLDWIWDSSCVSCWDRTPEWSLTKYLRSNVHYYRWQFTKSLEVAAARGDLTVVKWLFKHFEGCEAPSSVIDAAARNGHLNVLQFLLPFKAEDGEKMLDNLCRDVSRCSLEKSEEGNVVHWGEDVMLRAAEKGHVQLVRWLYDNKVHEVHEDQRIWIIEHALRNGDCELADHLLPSGEGQIVLDYDRLSPSPELIEWMMELGYFRWDEHAVGSAVRDLADAGRFELMQQILLLHSPIWEDEEWLEYWGEALEKACTCGDLQVLEWLMEHPLGRKKCQEIRQTRYMDDLLCVAAGEGHIHVARYLYDQGAGDPRGNAMVHAARQGRTDTVQWLLGTYSYTTQMNGRLVIYEAVSHGHVEILSLLHKFDSARANEPSVQGKRKKTPYYPRWDRLGDIMKFAATRGQLDVLKWFHSNRTLKSSQKAINRAAAHGHLDVVKWLHTQSQESSYEAMDNAASAGHLDVVQWLHLNRSEGCTADAMDLAAKGGHLEVIKWIHTNRSEGCTNMAIENAVTNGHLGVAYWLAMHASEHSLQNVDIAPNDFEMLVFLNEHFPHVITAHNIKKIQRASRRAFAKADPLHHVANWLAEGYSV